MSIASEKKVEDLERAVAEQGLRVLSLEAEVKALAAKVDALKGKPRG